MNIFKNIFRKFLLKRPSISFSIVLVNVLVQINHSKECFNIKTNFLTSDFLKSTCKILLKQSTSNAHGITIWIITDLLQVNYGVMDQ